MEMGDNQREGVEENNKHYLEIKYNSQRSMQEFEKRYIL